MAYGFNEDRSKVEIYSADQIDAMDLVNDEALAQEIADRQTAISQEANARSSGDSALNSRISNIIAQGQSTEGNTELIDIRHEYNGKTSSLAGDAVREQFDNCFDIIDEITEETGYLVDPVWDENKNIVGNQNTGFFSIDNYDGRKTCGPLIVRKPFRIVNSTTQFSIAYVRASDGKCTKFSNYQNPYDSEFEGYEDGFIYITAYNNSAHHKIEVVGNMQDEISLLNTSLYDAVDYLDIPNAVIDTNGRVRLSNNFSTSNFIPVKPGMSFEYKLFANPNSPLIASYDSEKNFSSVLVTSFVNDWSQGTLDIDFTGFLRITHRTASSANSNAVFKLVQQNPKLDALYAEMKNQEIVVEQGATSAAWCYFNDSSNTVAKNGVDIIAVNDDEDPAFNYAVVYKAGAQYCIINSGELLHIDPTDDQIRIQFSVAGLKKQDNVVKGGKATVYWNTPVIKDYMIEYNSIDQNRLANGAVTEDKFEYAELPSYVQENVDRIKNELDANYSANALSVAFITDLHVLAYAQAWQNDTSVMPFKRIVNAIRNIDRTNNIDFVVLGGDYLNNNNNTTHAYAANAYSILQKVFYPLRDKLFALKGNHDDNTIQSNIDNVIFDPERFRFLGSQYVKNIVSAPGKLERSFGYKDFPNQKVRVIFINNEDVIYDNSLTYKGQGDYGIRNDQIQFIKDALTFDEPGWGVVVFSHIALTGATVFEATAGLEVFNMIKAFANNSTYVDSGTVYGEPWSINADFTDNPSNEVIACICGHTHSDKTTVIDGIRLISTTCAAHGLPSTLEDDTIVWPSYQAATETAFDIFTFDRANRRINATRYGLGISRQFTY